MYLNLIDNVAIHNKNGKGLLHCSCRTGGNVPIGVAIHNKNGKGLLLHEFLFTRETASIVSQSTIKMEKGYYPTR